jgi:hypothetical protein
MKQMWFIKRQARLLGFAYIAAVNAVLLVKRQLPLPLVYGLLCGQLAVMLALTMQRSVYNSQQ